MMPNGKEIVEGGGSMDLTPYLDRREYDRDVFIKEARHFGEMALTGMLEAGKRLICLKIMEGHGGYMEALEEIGIPHQRANELVRIAQLITERLPQLPGAGDLRRLDTMGKTRLQLLARLTDEELAEELEDKKDLDEIARMPIAKLREYVRDLKKEKEKGMKQNTRLRKRIDDMQAQPKLEKLEKIQAWSDQIFVLQTKIMTKLSDGNAPEAEDFEGVEGEMAQAAIEKITILNEQIRNRFENDLKGGWGIE